MAEQTYQNPDQPSESEEKHVPIIEIGKDAQKGEKEVKVKIGAVAHPMDKDHRIEWLKLEIGDRKVGEVIFSQLDQKAEAVIAVKVEKGDKIKATEHCNLHGTWYNSFEV